jgi:hypothetical protein
MKHGGCGFVPADGLLAEKHLLELHIIGFYFGRPGSSDLEHVRRIESENVILYGQYVLNSDDIF